jgi:ketosteroid isomerase-like protein
MNADAQTEAAMVGMLDSFCCAFQARDAEAVMRLCARDPDVVVVTSEESLLRGANELQAFLRAYVQGPTTYSWTWDRLEVSTADAVAWLLAEGTETATTQAGEQ